MKYRNKINTGKHNYVKNKHKLKTRKRKRIKKRLRKAVQKEIRLLFKQNRLLKSLLYLLSIEKTKGIRDIKSENNLKLLKDISRIEVDKDQNHSFYSVLNSTENDNSSPELTRMHRNLNNKGNDINQSNPVRTQIIGYSLLNSTKPPVNPPMTRLASPYRIEDVQEVDKIQVITPIMEDSILIEGDNASTNNANNSNKCAKKEEENGSYFCTESESNLTKTIKEYKKIKFKSLNTHELESTHNEVYNNSKLNINANAFKPSIHQINENTKFSDNFTMRNIINSKELDEIKFIKERIRSEEDIDLEELNVNKESCETLKEFLIDEGKNIKSIDKLYDNILHLEKTKKPTNNKLKTTISEIGKQSHTSIKEKKSNKNHKRSRDNTSDGIDDEDIKDRIDAYAIRLVHLTLEAKENEEKISKLRVEMDNELSRKSDLETENQQLKQKIAKLQAERDRGKNNGQKITPQQTKLINHNTKSTNSINSTNNEQFESTSIHSNANMEQPRKSSNVSTKIVGMEHINTSTNNVNQSQAKNQLISKANTNTTTTFATKVSGTHFLPNPITCPMPQPQAGIKPITNSLTNVDELNSISMQSRALNDQSTHITNPIYTNAYWHQQLQEMAARSQQASAAIAYPWQNWIYAMQSHAMQSHAMQSHALQRQAMQSHATNGGQQVVQYESKSNVNNSQEMMQSKSDRNQQQSYNANEHNSVNVQKETSNRNSYTFPLKQNNNSHRGEKAQVFSTVNNQYQNNNESKSDNLEYDEESNEMASKSLNTTEQSDGYDENEEIEVQKSDEGGQPQDIRFKLTIKTQYEMDESYDNSNKIMKDIIANFREHGSFEGPLEIKRKDDFEIVITGKSRQDIALLSSKAWHPDCFGGANVISAVLKVQAANPEPQLMLIGKCHEKLNDDALEWMQASGVRDINIRGNNKIELSFENEFMRNKALRQGYVQAGGQVVKVEEWKKEIDMKQCFNCWKYQHYKANCRRSTKTCRYCAKENSHDSWHCPDKLNRENHRCINCKGRKGHEACDRMNCLYFINEYLNKCKMENIEPDIKYKNKSLELKNKYEQEDVQSRKISHLNSEYTLNSQINRKIAKTWVVNKLIYQGRGSETINQSQIVNQLFNDESILEEYETNKQRYLTEPSNSNTNNSDSQKKTISNFQKRKQNKNNNKNKNDSH
jgi:hypothetical protein